MFHGRRGVLCRHDHELLAGDALGRVSYSRLKGAAGVEGFMEIEWC